VGDLRVDVGGLHTAAASSGDIAAELTGAASGSSTSSHPSAAGVTAVDAAISATRQRQSTRISGQATDLTTGAGHYENTDGDGGQAITTVSV
jgi:hypothetical protein